MAKWKNEGGDWTRFRALPGVVEVDFHRSCEEYDCSYDDLMAGLRDEALNRLKRAQKDRARYVLFCHGWSTSKRWKRRTTRSVVRGLMRSPDATPYIVRKECIQHRTVFVAAVRPKGCERVAAAAGR